MSGVDGYEASRRIKARLGRDTPPTTRVEEIEARLANTELVAHFAAVATTARKLRARQAIVELERFREYLARQPQER